MSTLASPTAEAFGRDLQSYKEESEKVRLPVVRCPPYLLMISAHRKLWMSTNKCLSPMARLKGHTLLRFLSCRSTTGKRPNEVTLQSGTSPFPFICSIRLIILSFRSVSSLRSHLPDTPSRRSKPVGVNIASYPEEGIYVLVYLTIPSFFFLLAYPYKFGIPDLGLTFQSTLP